MHIQSTPLVDLKFARDCVAVEAFSLSGILASLKSAMPSLITGLFSTVETLSLPKLEMRKDQAAFFKALGHVPYTDVMEIKAYRPEGVKVTYLRYLHELVQATDYFKGIQQNVVQPYLLFVAQVVSDKNASLVTDSQEAAYTKLEANRAKMTSAFAALYTPNSYDAKCKVKDVVERHADWKTVFEQLNHCMADLGVVNLENLKLQLKQSTDYLTIIFDLLKAGKMEGATPEVAKRLSNGAYNVAKELEAFSATYYRALALGGSISNTTEHILKSIG